MIFKITELAEQSVARYGRFLNVLRSQFEVTVRFINDEVSFDQHRQEALSVARGELRSFEVSEQAELNEDSADIARLARSDARTDAGLKSDSIPDEFADFIFQAAFLTVTVLDAQARRDIMSMMQGLQETYQRVDLYQRVGNRSRISAVAAVIQENNINPKFQFVDRIGRRYKSSKHIRATYRAHLLNVYNEIYMATAAELGYSTLFIDHPNVDYKWYAEEISISPDVTNIPSYQDIKDEVFHPSSQAQLKIAMER